MLYRVFLSICLLFGFATANLNQQTTVLKNVKEDSATIDIGNLSIGQTGVIIHNFDESKSIITADFEVVTTSLNQSTVKFTYIDYDNTVAIP
ncbi:MAG: plasminogen-binding N-terminal domain-containing protein, partial [Arcobacteraceae bacterium]|nr:plasminogen-binding N-terminal domain-containing protein [Arcobacteraceae bacterium]